MKFPLKKDECACRVCYRNEISPLHCCKHIYLIPGSAVSDFAENLGLLDFSKLGLLKDIFNFRMDTVTLSKVLDILESTGLGNVKSKITRILNGIQVRTVTYMFIQSKKNIYYKKLFNSSNTHVFLIILMKEQLNFFYLLDYFLIV